MQFRSSCGGGGSQGSQGRQEEGAVVGVEASVLSEAWTVFEQMLRAAPASQPLVLLATCHAHPSLMPDALLAFFGVRQPPPGRVAPVACCSLPPAALSAGSSVAPRTPKPVSYCGGETTTR
jgi:hypothetical protein